MVILLKKIEAERSSLKLPEKQINNIMALMVSKSDEVKKLIDGSFLKDRIKRSYLHTYQLKLKKLGD